MSNPTTSIRVDVKRRLFELIANANIEAVQVTYGHPREGIEETSIFLGKVTGQQAIRDMRTGRKTRTDVFDVEIFLVAVVDGDEDGGEADDAAVALLAQVDDLLAEHPTLDDGSNGLPGVNHCYLTEIDGPEQGLIGTGRWSSFVAKLHCVTTTS